MYLDEGSDEYKHPVEFFRRMYLTESLKRLLVGAVQRLSGKGGDPVVRLQTNFGGGKTHSMLALYHPFSGKPSAEPAGIEDILKEAGLPGLPMACARQLHDAADLPGGSFETRFSFAQALTESAKAARQCLVVISLPASSGQSSVEWQAIRLQGSDALAVRASKKLRNEELLVTALAGTRLRMELDRVPLWRGDHVAIKRLVEDFARYLYPPHPKNPTVLVGAHLAGLPGAELRVRLEIEASIPNGVPEQIVRTVTENSRTLKFSSHGFERE